MKKKIINNIDWEAVRKDFPAVNEYTYLDSSSISLMPMPVQKKLTEFSDKINYAGTVSFDEEAEINSVEGTRAALSRLLNCSEENLAVINCVSEGLCQVAWGVQPKGTILLIDIEHPSGATGWARVAKQTGAQLKFLQFKNRPSELSTEEIIANIDDATSVVCVGLGQYSNGAVIDMDMLAKACHEKNALCIIDAIQAAGVVPIDLSKSEVDALAVGGYKWLCGPFGAAGLYISDKLKSQIEPAFVGWRSMKNPYFFDATRYEYNTGLRGYEFGTISYAAGYAFGESIKYLLDLGIENINKRVHEVSAYLMKRLDEIGAEVQTPRENERRTGTVFARFPGHDGEAVAAELNRNNVIVSPRFGGTRFACHFFNNEADIDRAIEVLVKILAR